MCVYEEVAIWVNIDGIIIHFIERLPLGSGCLKGTVRLRGVKSVHRKITLITQKINE